MTERRLELLSARTAWAFDVLACEVARGRALGYIPGEVPTSGAEDPALARAEIDQSFADHPTSASLERARFTADEQDALWLVYCVDREPALARLASAVNGGTTDKVTVGMLERLFTCDVEDLVTQGALVTDRCDLSSHRRGVDLGRPLRALFANRLAHDAIEPWSDDLVVDANARQLASRALHSRGLVIASGTPGLGRRSLLASVAADAGYTVRVLEAMQARRDSLSSHAVELALECRLSGALPLILEVDMLGEHAAMLASAFARIEGPILATSSSATCKLDLGRPTLVIEMHRPTTTDLSRIWQRALSLADDRVAHQFAEQFPLAPGWIHRAAEAARVRGTSTITIPDIAAAIRTVADDRLGAYARRVSVPQSWNDVVLAEDQMLAVDELLARIRRRSTVYEQWGFARKVARGLGVAALFSGPPGTGKTLVASLVAKQLGLDLYIVDMGKVVSKFIGETEKNLGALFDAAEAGHSVLLFDEADSLFGKRTDVKSSNDRYANLETNYLLQRLESFSGICFLTTNHAGSIDDAFQRRLSLHLRFELPGEQERELLWRTTIPAQAPLTEDLPFAALARRYEMSGGYIRNATLRAAFLAAEQGSAITAGHLERAARVEYEGMGKLAF